MTVIYQITNTALILSRVSGRNSENVQVDVVQIPSRHKVRSVGQWRAVPSPVNLRKINNQSI